ncbi:DUF5959 family protein [Streptomyces sp. NRRL F-5123]|uniref:DUF5959 family protein n=1 Tax=Streptomyces sp. NRRL F-5123 TaxID=1463856 RepID=UPI0004E13710|nr:DUF5959 family protein [Streptomyces sp. NRRL F-5123]
MAEEPIDLIRFEGDGGSVVLRISGKDKNVLLTGEFVVGTPFVSGGVMTRISGDDLGEWQQALDLLDTGHEISWRDGANTPGLYVEFDEDDGKGRCHVTVKDARASGTAVTVPVVLDDAWFDDAYRRLDLVREFLERRED